MALRLLSHTGATDPVWLFILNFNPVTFNTQFFRGNCHTSSDRQLL